MNIVRKTLLLMRNFLFFKVFHRFFGNAHFYVKWLIIGKKVPLAAILKVFFVEGRKLCFWFSEKFSGRNHLLISFNDFWG